MSRRTAVIASDPEAEEAARAIALDGGSALGAVLAGFFAAAGSHPGVLLGPVTLLVGGTGRGARAFDGRLRQPGWGAKRPRGFPEGEPIPDAARVGVPMGVAALLVAHAYEAGQGLGPLLGAGVQAADRAGAPSRAALLGRIRAAGAHALMESAFQRALLRVAGPSQGGLLTHSDFTRVPELDLPAVERPGQGGVLAVAPWAGELEGVGTPAVLGSGSAIGAVDARGMFAVLCYRKVERGLGIDELDLVAPLLAVPVRRGVSRLGPGVALPSPAPIALWRAQADSAVSQVLAVPGALRMDDAAPPEGPLAGGLIGLRRDPQTLSVSLVRTPVACA